MSVFSHSCSWRIFRVSSKHTSRKFASKHVWKAFWGSFQQITCCTVPCHIQWKEHFKSKLLEHWKAYLFEQQLPMILPLKKVRIFKICWKALWSRYYFVYRVLLHLWKNGFWSKFQHFLQAARWLYYLNERPFTQKMWEIFINCRVMEQLYF